MSVATDLAHEWGLALGDSYPEGCGGMVRRVTCEDGTPAVLKIYLQHRETEHEPHALEVWDGQGAVQLLARDDERRAMLLERCVPGTPLTAAGAEEAMDVLVGLLPRLWVKAESPFRPLTDEAAWWASYLADTWERTGRPYERRLLDAALELLGWLPGSQGERVLLNQDLHTDNVLAAEREPWLLIDPKPLAGEREFQAGPVVRSKEIGHSRRDVLWRLDRLCGDLGLDRDRAQGWTVVQTMAWCMDEDRPLPDHLDVVRWLLDAT